MHEQDRSGRDPIDVFTMLLLTQQFERATAQLFHAEASKGGEYAEEALHFALVLHHEGLLSTAAADAQPRPHDGLLLDTDDRFLLAALLRYHLTSWAAESADTAVQVTGRHCHHLHRHPHLHLHRNLHLTSTTPPPVQYVMLLRGDERVRVSLAVEVMQLSGTGALLVDQKFQLPQVRRRLAQRTPRR